MDEFSDKLLHSECLTKKVRAIALHEFVGLYARQGFCQTLSVNLSINTNNYFLRFHKTIRRLIIKGRVES